MAANCTSEKPLAYQKKRGLRCGASCGWARAFARPLLMPAGFFPGHFTPVHQILYDWDSTSNSVTYGGDIEAMLGFAPSEMGRDLAHWVGLIHVEDQPRFGLEIQRVLLTGAVFELEYRVRRKNGTFVEVEDIGQFVRDSTGHPIRMLGFVRDVTRRKQNEKALALQQQANFALFNPNPVLELSAAGDVTFANDAAHQMTREFGKKTVRKILPPDVEAIARQCLATGKPRLRVEIETAGRMISWSFFPLPAGEVVHCYGGDISERKRLEETVRHAQKMEAIGHLSGGIAHDFNNLLTVIQGEACMILSRAELSAQNLQSLASITGAAERAANLTRQLLTFSRKQRMQRVVLDLARVVADMAKLLDRVLGENVTMSFDGSSGPFVVHADGGMIEQVMLNLAVNARDAMPAGGSLTIALAQVGPMVRLSVEDTGIGIPPDILPKIFDPFFTTKEVGKGTGLGLATVFGIVEQHGGRIEVTSTVNRGTCFRVFLPRSTEPLVTQPVSVPEALGPGTETILLVEDEALVRSVTEQLLRGKGYSVISAVDATEALARWAEHRDEIALLLTDLIMPGRMSGQQLAATLRAESPGLRIVYMSGYSRELIGNTLLQEGLDFLTKPFDADRLLRVVRASLQSSRSTSPFSG